uniref:Pyridoxal kinase n=1 Tax=Salmo salar TaxID=8030 RepID=B5X612_SALSA|nr:Pyridoxal kinase [Salmo salar]
MSKGKVLSIQSYVVSSYVGGKGVTLTLETNGYDVNSIYSVIFSNHTAYVKIFGSVQEESDFSELYNGLKHNQLNHYDYVISGFMRSSSFANYLSKVLHELKQQNPNIFYLCDPVLGDKGVFYCPESFVEMYNNQLLPFADVTTPNQFEAEKLSGVTIKSKPDAIMACRKLHQFGASTVIITSVEGLTTSPKTLTCVLSDTFENEDDLEIKTIFIDFPKLDQYAIGTGDCFAALIIATFDYRGFQITFQQKIDAVCRSLTAMNRIIQRSLLEDRHIRTINKEYQQSAVMNHCELALADCIDIILDLTTTNENITLSRVTTSNMY